MLNEYRVQLATKARHDLASRPRGDSKAVLIPHGHSTTRLDERGFTLVEMLLVVAIMGILAGVVAPRVVQARANSIETSAIGSLRAINSAQVMFANSCGNGSFAPSIVWLATPPTGSKTTFIGPEFKTDPVKRLNYTFTFTAGTVDTKAAKTCNGLAAGKAVRTYFLAADPQYLATTMPSRYFGTNSDGAIYQSTQKVRAFYSGVAAAPAKIIQ